MKNRFRILIMKKNFPFIFLCCLINYFHSNAQTANDSIPVDSAYNSNTFLTLSLNTYLPSNQSVVFSPAVSFRYHQLYTSLRYNYEALNTATITAGYSFDGGNKTWFSISPLFGYSFGDYRGISPEIAGLIGRGNFAFVFDGAYSISFVDSVSNLFLLSASGYYVFNSWLIGGLTLQQSRIVAPLNAIDAGAAVGFIPGAFTFIFQANQFWTSDRYFQISASYFFSLGKNPPHKEKYLSAPREPGNN